MIEDDTKIVQSFESRVSLPWYEFYKKLWWQILYCKLMGHNLIDEKYNVDFEIKKDDQDWQHRHEVVELKVCSCCGYLPFQKIAIDITHKQTNVSGLRLVKD